MVDIVEDCVGEAQPVCCVVIVNDQRPLEIGGGALVVGAGVAPCCGWKGGRPVTTTADLGIRNLCPTTSELTSVMQLPCANSATDIPEMRAICASVLPGRTV